MFVLHPTLAADTLELARWPLSRVLLMNDSRYPWLILVPQHPGLRELHHLSPPDQGRLMEEIERVSRALEMAFQPDKINVGALGNLVEQLHIHVVARFRDDDAWPAPVWGKLPRLPYAPEALARTLDRIREVLTP